VPLTQLNVLLVPTGMVLPASQISLVQEASSSTVLLVLVLIINTSMVSVALVVETVKYGMQIHSSVPVLMASIITATLVSLALAANSGTVKPTAAAVPLVKTGMGSHVSHVMEVDYGTKTSTAVNALPTLTGMVYNAFHVLLINIGTGMSVSPVSIIKSGTISPCSVIANPATNGMEQCVYKLAHQVKF
jgi:hypothetical protein